MPMPSADADRDEAERLARAARYDAWARDVAKGRSTRLWSGLDVASLTVPLETEIRRRATAEAAKCATSPRVRLRRGLTALLLVPHLSAAWLVLLGGAVASDEAISSRLGLALTATVMLGGACWWAIAAWRRAPRRAEAELIHERQLEWLPSVAFEAAWAKVPRRIRDAEEQRLHREREAFAQASAAAQARERARYDARNQDREVLAQRAEQRHKAELHAQREARERELRELHEAVEREQQARFAAQRAEWKAAQADTDDARRRAGNITPAEAEELAAEWMLKLGARGVAVTRFQGDGGIDVTSDRWIAQVKHYSGTVGATPIRELAGVAAVDGRRPVFFTSGTYSKGAKKFADAAKVALFHYDVASGTLTGINERGRVAVKKGLPAIEGRA